MDSNYDILTNSNKEEENSNIEDENSTDSNISCIEDTNVILQLDENIQKNNENEIPKENEVTKKKEPVYQHANTKRGIYEASKFDEEDDPWKKFPNIAEPMLSYTENDFENVNYSNALEFPDIKKFVNPATVPLYTENTQLASAPFGTPPNLDFQISYLPFSNAHKSFIKKQTGDLRGNIDLIGRNNVDGDAAINYNQFRIEREMQEREIKEEIKEENNSYPKNAIARPYIESYCQNSIHNDQEYPNTCEQKQLYNRTIEQTYEPILKPTIETETQIFNQTETQNIQQKHQDTNNNPTINSIFYKTQQNKQKFEKKFNKKNVDIFSDSDTNLSSDSEDDESDFNKYVALSKINRQKKQIKQQKKNMAKILKYFGGLLTSLSDMLDE